MIELLNKDMANRPDLFNFLGPVSEPNLDTWMAECNIEVPSDLKHLWAQTGGGDLFETETILAPIVLGERGENVEGENKARRLSGLSEDWIVFHVGLGGLSAVAKSTGHYASIDEASYQVRQTFKSIEDWYSRLIHNEYAVRYGLDSI